MHNSEDFVARLLPGHRHLQYMLMLQFSTVARGESARLLGARFFARASAT